MSLEWASLVSIRPYEPRDLDGCRELWVELTEWHRSIFETPSIGGDDPGRQFDAHLARVGAERIWVADENGELVGLAGLVLEHGEAELEPIVVSKRLRSRGVGRRLAEAVIEHAREHRVRQLQVRPVGRNAEAIRFFHRLGFDVLDQVVLMLDLVTDEPRPWRDGELVAARRFRV